MLRAPFPLRSLRDVPLLGSWIHRLSHHLVPADVKIWAQIEAGPAQGLWLELNPRTGQNYLRGKVELAVQRVLAERLRPGMTVYDLGANIGLFSLLAARLVGATGKVVSFEPDPGVAARLRRNIARNAFANITVVESGVWSESGPRGFFASNLSSPDRGVGSFLPDINGSATTLIPCVSLDDFVRSAPPPDAIKCDVEGAEAEVFRSAEKLLRARRPWIVCEMHSQPASNAVQDQLRPLGYSFEPIDEHHLLASPLAPPVSDGVSHV